MNNPTGQEMQAPRGKTLLQRMRAFNRYREHLNPFRALTIQRAVQLLEQYQRGEWADIMWTLYWIEQADPDLHAVIERRTSAVCELDWDIKIVEDADEAKAQRQAEHLRAVYDGIENLNDAIAHMELAFVRGVSVIQKQAGQSPESRTATILRPTHLECLQPWRILRDGLSGDLYWNPDGMTTGTVGLPEASRLNPEADALIVMENSRPIIRIALLKFIRSNLNEKDWDSFVEIYGIPSAIIVGPQNVPQGKEEQYRTEAEKAAEGGSGYLPYGSTVNFSTEASLNPPFKERLDHLSEKLILAATGGTLTMLTQSGSGTLAGEAHAETFRMIARRSARRISEAMQRAIDRVEIAAAFPNQPVLAYWELSDPDKVDAGTVIDHAVKLDSIGMPMEAGALQEATGYTLLPANAGADDEDVIDLNNSLRGDVRSQAAAVMSILTKAARADLEPLARRIQDALALPDDEQYRNAMKLILSDIPSMVGTDTHLAAALEKAMSSAFASGVVREDKP